MFQNYWILLIEVSSTMEELFFNENDEKKIIICQFFISRAFALYLQIEILLK